MQQVLISYLFYILQRVYVNPNFPIHPTLPPGVHTFVLCICVSISAFQLCPSAPFFFFRFHIYALIYDICFSLSDLLHSVGQSLRQKNK